MKNFLVLFYISVVYGISDAENYFATINHTIPQNFINFQNDIFKEFVEYLDDNNTLCYFQLKQLLMGIQNSEKWALQMIDSWGKFPSGILYGNLIELGNFDECLSISETLGDNDEEIQGKYCLATIPINYTMTPPDKVRLLPFENEGFHLSFGTCFPKSCNVTLLQTYLNTFLKENFNMTFLEKPFFTRSDCITNETTEFSGLEWFAIVFFACFCILLLASTMYDLAAQFELKQPHPLLVSFSIPTNAQKLFKTSNKYSPDVLRCLDGIRCLSLIWVVFGHSYVVTIADPIINLSSLNEWQKTYFSMCLISATVSVDSFFLLSGLLVGWVVFKYQDRKEKNIILKMYIHRYIRLTPVLAIIIFFSVTLLHRIGTAPYWEVALNTVLPQCEKYWWSSLLYVQNYVNPDEMCLGHTWYLSTDTQLFFLSPIILFPLGKWGKKFAWVIVLLILLSISCTFTTYMLNDFSMQILGKGLSEMMERMRLTYYPTHTRMGPWLIGLLFGYYLYKTKSSRTKLGKLIVSIGWIISLVTILAIIFGPYRAQQQDSSPSTLQSAFSESLTRVSWAIALVWIIFACTNGYGGILDKFLSHSLWQPFSRLTYCIYLSHFLVQTIRGGLIKNSNHFSDFESIRNVWSDFGYSLSVAVFLYLTFEIPIANVESYCFSIKRKVRTVVTESQQNLGSTPEISRI